MSANDNNENGGSSNDTPIVIPVVPPSDRTSLSEGVVVPKPTSQENK